MSSTQSEAGLWNGLRLIGTAVATFIVVAGIITVFTGTPVLAGLFLGLENAVYWVALIAGLVWIGYRTDEFSIGFIVLTVGVVIVASPLLPNQLTRPFAFISEALFGTQLSAFDRVEFFVLSVAVVIGLWSTDIRLTGRAKNPGAIAGRLQNRFKSVGTQYRKILAAAGAIIITTSATISGAFGDIAGELVRVLASAPVISGFGAAVAGYYYNHIAGIPLVGSVGPWVFFGLLVAVFGLAVGTRFNQ